MNGRSAAGVLPVIMAQYSAERLTSLFDSHYGRLYRLARRLTPGIDDALDLVQETFLRATRFLKSIPVGASSEEAWLVRTLINIRRDQWRKRSARVRHEGAASRASIFANGGRNTEAVLIARDAVWQALDTLSPRRRAIVVMHELEEMAIPAIASLLGISAITVRWHLSMGRRDLTEALKPHMGDANDKN